MPSIFQRSKLKSTNVKQTSSNKHIGAERSWAARHIIKEGFPVTEPFKSIEEIKEYLNKPRLTCLLCGGEFKWLSGTHFKRVHDITEREYKDRYNLPYAVGLICYELKAKKIENAKKHSPFYKIHSKPQDQKNYRLDKNTSTYKRMTSSANVLTTPTHNKHFSIVDGKKECSKCHNFLLVENYYVNRRNNSLFAQCKNCENKRKRDNYNAAKL